MPKMPLYHIIVLSFSISGLAASGCGIADKIRDASTHSKALVAERNVGGRSNDASAGASDDASGERNSGDNNPGKCGKAGSAQEVRKPENPFGLEGAAEVTYEGSIKGMINSKCAWCHSPTASRPQTPYLTTYDEVKGQGANVFQAMTDRGEDRMPPRFVRPQLNSDDIRLFAFWRDGGYKKTTPPPPPPNPASGMFYIDDIKSLMANQCVGCHSPGAIAPDLSSYAGVKAAASVALAAMQNGTMPKAGPLPAAQIAGFKSWVDAKTPYAKDNTSGTGAPAAGTPPPPADHPQDPARPEDKGDEQHGECAS